MKDPYPFDGPYELCYVDPGMAMDPRHVYMVNGVLSAWPFTHALEIGSFYGASSTAFVEAINNGSPMATTFCDIEPSAGLHAVVNHCDKQGRCAITKLQGWEVLAGNWPFDFVLVDACHDIASVTPELEQLLRRKPLCVMAHDTNATAAGYGQTEGAAMLKAAFKSHPDYMCLEDAIDRPGEQTKRGLFLATKDPELHRLASAVFESFSGAIEWQTSRMPQPA